MPKHVDLTGQQIAYYTVLKPAGRTSNGFFTYHVRCRCQRKYIVTTDTLQRARRHSGCRACFAGRNQYPPATDASVALRLMKAYQWFARYRGLRFMLTPIQFHKMIKSACAYCGIAYSSTKRGTHKRADFHYNGIDRKDNRKGYTPHNTVACCKTCNHAKATLTVEQFLEWAKRLSHYQSHR